ncbi:MAG: wrbA, partial [Clostridiales bacterium]|nr:wrbA [Clostridiales bacterium]
MKATVIFHSVSGNTYLLAREVYEKLSLAGVQAEIYRVRDDDLEELSNEFPLIKEYYSEIIKLPVINLDTIVNSDYIFMGSPTYFGNVSSELKAFMDSFAPIWVEGKLFGKKLVAFTTCGTPEGGGDMCLQAINIFGQH